MLELLRNTVCQLSDIGDPLLYRRNPTKPLYWTVKNLAESSSVARQTFPPFLLIFQQRTKSSSSVLVNDGRKSSDRVP